MYKRQDPTSAEGSSARDSPGCATIEVNVASVFFAGSEPVIMKSEVGVDASVERWLPLSELSAESAKTVAASESDFFAGDAIGIVSAGTLMLDACLTGLCFANELKANADAAASKTNPASKSSLRFFSFAVAADFSVTG